MITLSEHNVKPYNELCEKLENNPRCAYVAATGTGKSYVAAKYIEEHGLSEKTLVLVPARGIADGWAKMGLGGLAVKTYHWLVRNGASSVMGGKELIVCDEMHHLGAAEWNRAWQQISGNFSGKIIGLTATPVRFLDNCRNMVDECFGGASVSGPDLPSAIRDGILPHFHYVTALYDLPKRMPKRPEKGTGTTDRLFARLDLLGSEYSFTATLQKYMPPSGRHVIVFANRIGEIPGLVQALSALYPGASHREFHAKMPSKQAMENLNAFGDDPGMSFLYTVDMLSEGVHIGAVDTVIMFRRTESPIVYLQQIGRCLSSGNVGRDVLIFDFAANHNSVKSVRKGSGSVMEWIKRESGENPERQVIVDDYTVDELELLEKLNWELREDTWSEEENRILIENYKKVSPTELTKYLPGRSLAAIQKHVQALGFAVKTKSWTPEENTAIKERLKTMSIAEASRNFPGRSEYSVKAQIYKLGLHSLKEVKPWTAEENDAIKRMLETMSVTEVSRNFPERSENSVMAHIAKLGFCSSAIQKRPWTPKEDRLLAEMLKAKPQAEVRRSFPGRTESAVQNRIYKLNLHTEA